ncbi:MAG: hypothetical protein M1834_005029 [Cirrosporium novae-zelandiae]|nr:MAG: hypothetical protein M1834_005029 [Cirrosporium novae-zelandiae]
MGGERQRQRQRQRQLSPSEDVMSSFVSHADLKGVRSPNIVDGGLGRVWERERERGLGCAWGVGDEEGIMEWRDGIRDGDVGDRGREGKMKMNIVDTDVVSVDPMPLPTISGFRHQHHDHDYHHPDQAISTTEPPHPHLHAFPVPLKRDDHDKSKEQNPRQSSGMKRLKTLTSMESRIGVRAVSWWKVDGSRKGDVEDEEWVYDWE